MAQRSNGEGTGPAGGSPRPEGFPSGRQLIVIAKSETGLRARPEEVTSVTAADVDPLRDLLASEGATLQPLFGASEERLTAEADRLATTGAEDVPDLSVYYRVEGAEERLDDLAESLRQMDGIEGAYVKPPPELAQFMLNEMAPVAEEPPVVTPNFTSRQDYLERAPEGIDANYASTRPGGRGEGVNIIDIERGWRFTHEDLLQNQGGVVSGTSFRDSENHGTAVLGEFSGDRNTFGITGISPDASVSAVSYWPTTLTSQAIRIAANRLRPGDIILLEVHYPGPRWPGGETQFGFIAIEWYPDDLDAIRYAVSKGVIVVEAAGNGGQNLDDPVYDTPQTGFPPSWRNPFNPANPSSGAVVVGAGNPPAGTHGRNAHPSWGEPYADRARCYFSNYGARVDAQGWGWEVTSTGYGDLQGGPNRDLWYTDLFSGTSSASPIVVGALACVQGVLRRRGKTPLSPARAQQLLRSTGSPQQDGPGFTFTPNMSGSGYPQDYPARPATERIGNRPNLRQLLDYLDEGREDEEGVVSMPQVRIPEEVPMADVDRSDVDRYLIQAFENVESEIKQQELQEYAPHPGQQIRLPMLLRVRDLTVPLNIPDLQITSRVGNIAACLGSLQSIHHLRNDPNVVSIEASRPPSGEDISESVPFVKADQVHRSPNLEETGDHALIAIIDDGIDILHGAFLDDAGHTRVVALWDQTDSTGPAPGGPQSLDYGTLHEDADINSFIDRGAVPPSLRAGPHGTHVASIAAGRAVGRFAGGIAPEAKILFIKPRISVGPNDPFSLGYSNSHIDALAFVGDWANRLKLPVVVNLSQGMNAGAHDGTSNLEAGFDGFTGGGRLPGRVVVKSAGNERGHDGHAKLFMPSNSYESLGWTSVSSHRGPDVAELWFRSSDDLEFRVTDPSSESTGWVGPDKHEDHVFGTGNRCIIDYHRYHSDNGDSRLLATITAHQGTEIERGEWRLEINSGTVRSDGILHAWLERDIYRPILFSTHTNEEMTLSIPGTARTVIAVAAVDKVLPLRVTDFSSYGPTRDGREKPELAAPGQAIEAARAGTPDDVVAMSGTSMATPHVAGSIALLLSRRHKQCVADPRLSQYNAAQISRALCQTTTNFNGRWMNSMGYGSLNCEAFIQLLTP